MEKIKKKGAIEMEYVIIAVILIIGFIALAYFLIRLNIQGLGEDTACKLSILAKATAPGLWFVDPKASIPIECVTKKICIGGECDGVDGSFQGEKNVESIELKNNAEKDLPVIEKTVADAFYNCWKDMGEGKFDLFGSHEDAKPRCVVCSRIALDKSIPPSTTDNINVNNYLKTKSPDNSKLNYLQSMGLKSKEDLSYDFSSVQAQGFGNIEDSRIGTKELAIVFMQVSAESGGESALEWLGGASGLGVLGTYGIYKSTGIPLGIGNALKNKLYKPTWNAIKNPAGSVLNSPTKTISPAKAGVARAGLFAVLFGAFIGFDESLAWADRIVVASHCGTYQSSGGKGSEGCSVVRILPYTRDSINFMCDVVEAEA